MFALLFYIFVPRGAVLDSTICLNEGGRYFVDIIFNKPPDSSSPHILVDSVRKPRQIKESSAKSSLSHCYITDLRTLNLLFFFLFVNCI